MKNCWINNKIAVISGASGGIGFNLSKLLIEKYNCTVYAIARNKEKLLSAKNSLIKPENFIIKAFDVSVLENWMNFKNELEKNNVIPDILINNAGFMLPFTKFDKLSQEEIEEIIKTDFISTVNSCKLFIPLLKKSTSPAIINISSAAGLCAVIGESMYCACKYAVRGFTDTIRQEYKENGFYIAGVYPGFVKTNILNRMSVSDKENRLINKLMMPVEKASEKIVKGIKKRKKSIVMGYDGKSMSFFGKRFPIISSNAITLILKKSKLDLFNNVFDKDVKE